MTSLPCDPFSEHSIVKATQCLVIDEGFCVSLESHESGNRVQLFGIEEKLRLLYGLETCDVTFHMQLEGERCKVSIVSEVDRTACTNHSGLYTQRRHHFVALLALVNCDIELLLFKAIHKHYNGAVLERQFGGEKDSGRHHEVFNVAQEQVLVDRGDASVKLIQALENVSAGRTSTCETKHLLCRLVRCLVNNFLRPNARCYVCGIKHEDESTAPWPTPCNNALCRHAATTMGFVEVLPVLKQRSKAAMFLMSLTKAAATSLETLGSYPPDYAKIDGELLKDVSTIVDVMPQALTCHTESELLRLLNSVSPGNSARLQRLMWWCLIGTGSQIEPITLESLPEDVRRSMKSLTPREIYRVYPMVTGLTTSFKALANGAETFHGFHGSNYANWRSILHHGLRVMSGSKFEKNGAVSGAGIYVAKDAGMALSYCRSGPAVVGVVRYIGGSHIKKPASTHVVVQTSEAAHLSFLLVL